MTENRTYISPEDLTELIVQVQEVNNISNKLMDDDINQTLGWVIRLINRPDVSVQTATPLIVKMEAYSVLFKLKAKNYIFIDKSDSEARLKKEFFLTLSDSCSALSAALKYTTRNY